ncbi:hypothetical protein WICANDRAFT_81386 [Wickerhamomyces anomalus NRRL Y-366-8]|uniref:PPM-type phosphatase domain-containing protein n=1 Tax=Wickerhamomyces anomalus (strain ATCC 58044 / CBS 1984 / NCYC 433 / NRRL Y-366-8) TaxID=683960 RepID=A0A1E3NVN0_WICAA|nr:uncharacterized protein WICANDRAFT_81386 [Wickerhamomyces anomalus NRRL Y-366-8]ODQ57165.1 hypothetical protein WICANDRAFT_81386 [Wickerhamomyces anomalus NRRL Y-366-8]
MSHSTSNKDYKLSYSVGVAEDVNKIYRPTMEDVHTYVENFVERLDWGYFAIFDGHAGKQAAKWCGQNLHSIVEKKLIEDENEDVRDILNESFLEADENIVKTVEGSSGCTAAVAILRWELPENKTASELTDLSQHKRMLYTANVGDTRIVLFRNNKAIRLTYDHKASDKHEINRIEKSGGLIMKSRVNGMLAVTRSLGDQFFKDLVIGSPYTTSVELNKDTDKFLIIACDGLWDVISDQQACELIRDIEDSTLAAKKLVEHALNKLTTDNITVMVISLR